MPRGPAIIPADRSVLLPFVDAAIAATDATGEPASYDVALLVRRDVQAAEAAGETWAERVALSCLTEGLRLVILGRMNEDKGTVRLSHSGAVISIPARVGVLRPLHKTKNPKRFQRRLWWDLPWEEFETYVSTREGARDALSRDLAALHEIRRLRQEYPASATPAEACSLAGINPRKFARP